MFSLPPSPRPPALPFSPQKKKFSGISLRRELFPHCWDFLFVGVEVLAPRLGVSVREHWPLSHREFQSWGEITANRIQPQMMRMKGRWKRERIFPNIHKQIRKVWRRGQGDEEVRERAHLSPHPCLSTPKAGGYTGLCVAGTRELFARNTAGSWQPSAISRVQIREGLDFRLAKVIIGDFA